MRRQTEMTTNHIEGRLLTLSCKHHTMLETLKQASCVQRGAMMTFGDRIRELRRRKDLTLRGLAAKVEVSPKPSVMRGRLGRHSFIKRLLTKALARRLSCSSERLSEFRQLVSWLVSQRGLTAATKLEDWVDYAIRSDCAPYSLAQFDNLAKKTRLSRLVVQGAGHCQPYVNPRITLVLGLVTRRLRVVRVGFRFSQHAPW